MYISTISTLSYTDLPSRSHSTRIVVDRNHYLIKLATCIFLTSNDTAHVSSLGYGDDWKSLLCHHLDPPGLRKS